MTIFLFTNIEGSTQLWEHYPVVMQTVLIQHNALFKEIVDKHGGQLVRFTGDGVFAIFDDSQALACAIDMQSTFNEARWGEIDELHIRIGLHPGEVERYKLN